MLTAFPDAPVRLPGRTVITVAGSHRLRFLEGLVTQRVDDLEPGTLRHGALLTPQGKILTDMMIFGFDGFLQLDVPESAADDLLKRLTVYRLRAAVTFERTDEVVAVGAPGTGIADPRAETLGDRLITDRAADATIGTTADAYHLARYAAGIADAVLDYPLASAFPHDVNMDVTGSVDFSKGCFVGQEVVSRMRHRGTARRRTVCVSSDAPLPAAGTPILADGATVGTLGSSVGKAGLAIVRIDKAGAAAMAGDGPVRLSVPPGAPFELSGAVPAA